MLSESSIVTRAFGAHDAAPVRVWSLIATIYGDCALPRGGEMWLGDLTQILGALGVEPGSVRAAMSRLARQGFLARTRIGRTSHYRLTPHAMALSRSAEALIYRTRPPDPPDSWDLALTHRAAPDARKALIDSGFLAVGAHVFARPHRAGDPIRIEGALLLRATGDDPALAAQLFNMDALAARYQAFLSAAEVIGQDADTAKGLDAVARRVTLVHGFRRAVLRDPLLPAAAHPDGWPAARAYIRFAKLYQALQPASDAWLANCVQRTTDEPVEPPPSTRFLEPRPRIHVTA